MGAYCIVANKICVAIYPVLTANMYSVYVLSLTWAEAMFDVLSAYGDLQY